VKTLQAAKYLSCALSIWLCVEISDGVIIKCNYELCVNVISKSNYQSKTPSIVTLICDTILQYQRSRF
jgi:hypothetical protein